MKDLTPKGGIRPRLIHLGWLFMLLIRRERAILHLILSAFWCCLWQIRLHFRETPVPPRAIVILFNGKHAQVYSTKNPLEMGDVAVVFREAHFRQQRAALTNLNR